MIKMIRVDFGLHYSDAFENEAIALEELAEFIEEQYEDLAHEDDNNLSIKDKFLELGWEFEEIN